MRHWKEFLKPLTVIFILFTLFIGVEGSNLSQLACNGRSMRELALDMVAISGPRNSSMPWQKSVSIIKSSNQLIVLLGGLDIFSGLTTTLGQLIDGFKPKKISKVESVLFINELRKSPRKALPVVVESSIFAGFKIFRNGTRICVDNVTCGGRIILQSEQLHSSKGNKLKPYLEKCHQSLNCVIWDFCDYNYQWAVENGLQNSFLILPIMNQYRFHIVKHKYGPRLARIGNVTVSSRRFDIIFVGVMNSRRLHIKSEIERLHPNWKIAIFQESNKKRLVPLYHQSKICLTVHSTGEVSGGEYHRLSETALFG
jgi:hypothetical protein